MHKALLTSTQRFSSRILFTNVNLRVIFFNELMTLSRWQRRWLWCGGIIKKIILYNFTRTVVFTVVHYAVQFYMQSKSFSLNTLLMNNWTPIPLSSLLFTLSNLHPRQWNLGFIPDEFLQIWKGFLRKDINFKFREFVLAMSVRCVHSASWK